jgi:hypothetical protein
MSSTPIQQAKLRLPLPALMQRLGLGDHANRSARCPFHEDANPSFSVWQKDDVWFWKCHASCGHGDEITFLEKHKGINRHEAINLFLGMAGYAPVDRPLAVLRYKAQQANNTSFDWHACVEAVTEGDLERVGNERWLSRAFCEWLRNKQLIGVHNGHIAFPNGNGTVEGAHVWKGGKDWFHHPPGVGTHPFVIGDLRQAKQVHLFESQWDMLAFADRTGNYEAQGVIFVATRGNSNAKLVDGLIPPRASILAWPQNDEPGKKWLNDLSAIVPKLGVARVPISTIKRNEFGDTEEVRLKDMNDWVKAGASADNVYAAFFRNELFKPETTPSGSISIDQSINIPIAKSAKQSAANAKPQGSKVTLPHVEPWPDAVNGEEVLNEMAETFSRYAVLPEGASHALALWCAYAHGFDAFQCSPRLYVTSPEKGCGKSTLRDVIALFVPRPLSTENASVAVLFRLIEQYKPTVLADECDAWLPDNEELRGLLNAGHRRGGTVYRCEGDDHGVRGFDVFAPAVLCGLGQLPGTLFDRSIVIQLDRARPGELKARFDSRHVEKETELCRKAARFIADNKGLLDACDPALPDGVYNRLADNWRPLFAVAEIAGGQWPMRAGAAFRSLVRSDDLDAQGLGVTLLRDIREVFDCQEMFSRELVEKLSALDESPWKEFGRSRQPISMRQLGKLLKPYGICSRDVYPEGEHGKGYRLADFVKAFERYLPSPPPSKSVSV